MSTRRDLIIFTTFTIFVLSLTSAAFARPVDDSLFQEEQLQVLGENAPNSSSNSTSNGSGGSWFSSMGSYISGLWGGGTSTTAPTQQVDEMPAETAADGGYTNTITDTKANVEADSNLATNTGPAVNGSMPTATAVNPTATGGNGSKSALNTNDYVQNGLNTDQDELPMPDDISDEPTGKVDMTGLQSMMFAQGLTQNTANWAGMAMDADTNYQNQMAQFGGADPKMMKMMAILQLIFGVVGGLQNGQMDPAQLQQMLMGSLGTFMQAEAIKKQQDELEEQRDDQRLMAGIGAGSSLVGGIAGMAIGGPVGGAVGMGLGNAASNTAAPFVMGKKVGEPTLYADYPVQTTNCGVHSATPIVLDLNRNGKADLYDSNWRADRIFNPEGCVHFDIDGDGKLEFCEWIKPNGDGILVLDANNDGDIASQKELFGDSEGYENGYRKLQDKLDKDHDGYISGAELEPLKVWIDNGNGKSEEGELFTMGELGITHLGVEDNNLECFFTMHGQDYKSWDWFTEYIE